MAGTVSFEDKEWREMVKTIEKNIKDPKPVLKAAFSTRGFKDVIRHFNDEKGQDGQWIKSKRAEADGGKTLQDTGNLRRNFLPTNVENKGKDSIVFFNPTPYAAVHDLGSEKRNLPQREFMWLSDDAQEDMLKLILDTIVK